MISVFIYHSQPAQVQRLQKTMVTYFQAHQHTYRLTASSSYEDSKRYLRGPGKKDDLFFFDFAEFSAGIHLAGLLREQNPQAFWVFMDGAPERLYTAMLLQPSAYLPDSQDSGGVLETLRRLEQYHQMMQRSHYFCFKCEGAYLRVPFDDISYFESSAKKVTLQPAKGGRRYCFSAKLDDLAAQLPRYFLRCHQSYLVNMKMIRSLDTQNHVFLLCSKEEIFISRRSYREAKEQYQRFLEEQA